MNLFPLKPYISIGTVTYSKPSALGPRIQPGLQLVYVHKGEMTIQAGSHHYVLRANEATLLPPGRRERFLFGQTEPTRHGWCVLNNPSLSPADCALLEKLPLRIPFSRAMQSLERLALAVPLSDHSRRPYRDKLIEAMMLLFVSEAGGIEAEDDQIHPVITRSMQIMEQHMGEAITIRQIAELAGVSQTHLIRLYRRAGLQSPKKQLWTLRTREAARLLLETGLTASEIAYRTGFANPYHFSRVFKQFQKESPGRFRKSRWTRPA